MAVRVLLAAALWAVFSFQAQAQHNHATGHSEYQGWSSRKVSNCCDNRDCGALRDDEVRETTTGTEIRIGDQWCPVQAQHLLVRGRSPDWNTPHACVSKGYAINPCDRLLCFVDRGRY